MKKLKAFLLISFSILNCVACGQTDLKDETLNEVEVKEKVVPDMGGYKCKLLQWGFTDTADGDLLFYKQDTYLYDLAAQRISDVEALYNCDIEFQYSPISADLLNTIVGNIASGTSDGDIISVIELIKIASLVSSDCLYPLTDLKNIIDYEDSEKYGSAGLLEVAMKDSIPYAVTGAMLPLKQCLSGLPLGVFNAGVVADYGLTDLREYYEKKEWTWDTFETFLTDYTIVEGEKKIFAVETPSAWFIQGAMRSNGVEYAVEKDGKVVSGLDSVNTLQAFDWVKKVYKDFPDSINYKNVMMNEHIAAGTSILIFTEAIHIRDRIAYEVDNFGIVPFPCGPLGKYGESSTFSAMEAYGIIKNSEEPEYVAYILSSILEPFKEYLDKESLMTYYDNIFHDRRDIELYLSIDKYARHAYEPQGATIYYFADNISKKSSAEMIQSFAPQFNLVVEKYIAPNYEYMSTH